MTPLTLIRDGQVRIINIISNRDILNKLLGIGIKPGDIIKVVSNNSPGPVIISKDDVKIGIGFKMARKIIVEEINKG